MLLLFLFCLSKTRLSPRRRRERSHTHARARSVILTKRVPTLRALVKHSLSLVRASQLHGVKVQSLVFALGTLFVHRRALSRHLLLRPDLGPVRVLSLDAVMKLKVRRSRDELSLAVSERCARERVEIDRQSPETPAAAATPKSPSKSSPRRVRLRPTPRARRTNPIARVSRFRARSSPSRARLGPLFSRAPSSIECAFPQPEHDTVDACVDNRRLVPHRAQKPFPRIPRGGDLRSPLARARVTRSARPVVSGGSLRDGPVRHGDAARAR